MEAQPAQRCAGVGGAWLVSPSRAITRRYRLAQADDAYTVLSRGRDRRTRDRDHEPVPPRHQSLTDQRPTFTRFHTLASVPLLNERKLHIWYIPVLDSACLVFG